MAKLGGPRYISRPNLEQENARLREVVREQGEFIMSLKKFVSDFLGNA